MANMLERGEYNLGDPDQAAELRERLHEDVEWKRYAASVDLLNVPNRQVRRELSIPVSTVKHCAAVALDSIVHPPSPMLDLRESVLDAAEEQALRLDFKTKLLKDPETGKTVAVLGGIIGLPVPLGDYERINLVQGEI